MIGKPQIWRCELCDFTYDPEIGDPDSGIDPGTEFEDIPDDWYCPLCGARKADFTPIPNISVNAANAVGYAANAAGYFRATVLSNIRSKYAAKGMGRFTQSGGVSPRVIPKPDSDQCVRGSLLPLPNSNPYKHITNTPKI